MKKYVFASLVAVGMLLSISAVAQEKAPKRAKEKREAEKRAVEKREAEEKSEAEERSDMKEEDERQEMEEVEGSDEIIVRKKGEKGTKITIEINGSDVKVNGKPIDDFDDENVAVIRRAQPRLYSVDSRFRNMSPLAGFNGRYPDNLTVITADKAFLGVTTKSVDNGVEIVSVINASAAEKAGLKKGDIITKIEDKNIEDAGDLTEAISDQKPDDNITITYKRDGKESTVTAKLGKGSNRGYSQSYSFSSPGAGAFSPNESFGLSEDIYSDGLQQYFSFGGRPRLGVKAQDTEEGKGVKVLEVSKESLAEKAGIKVGDIITNFDGKTINSADDLVEAAGDSREKASVKVELTRDGKQQSIEIKTPKKLKTANL